MRTIIISALCSILLFSCSKASKEVEQSNYIKVKVDGVEKTFNATAGATKTEMSGMILFSVHGNVAAGSMEGINVAINGSEAIKAGSYSEEDASNDYTLGAVYGQSTSDIWAAGMNPNPSHPFTMTITEITATRVKGTFSGIMYNEHGMGSDAKLFTNGEFNVAIQ